MSNTVLTSATAAIEQPVEVSFDPRRGYTTTRKFRGTQAQLQSKELELISQGYSTRVRQGPGPMWELEATVGGDTRDGNAPDGSAETPVDTWELFANVVEQDLLRSTSPAVTGLSPSDANFLRKVLDGKIDIEPYSGNTTADWPAFEYKGGRPLELFRLIVSGVKSEVIYQPCVRHTKTVTSQNDITKSITNAGSIYSTARLIKDNAIPAGVSINLPPSYSETRDNNVVELFAGWLKVYPQIQVSAFSKSQVVQEFQWGKWPVALFDGYILR